jgi:hypothetical protein
MAAFLTERTNNLNAFDPDQGDIVEVIEIGPDHNGYYFHRNLVTEAFSRRWIENDFVSCQHAILSLVCCSIV